MCNSKESKDGASISIGIHLGALSIFISILGASLTFPFLQSERDRLGCGALCYGSMQSTRSGLTLVGTMVVGRLSDKVGRTTVLFIGAAASMLTYLINFNGDSIETLWLALIPAALLNHNFSVLKALFADYSSEYGYSESQRATAMGRLGMAVGISFMIGPVIGAHFLANYKQALIAAICLSVVASILLIFLPTLKTPVAVAPLLKGRRDGSLYSSDHLVRLVEDECSSTAVDKKTDKKTDNDNTEEQVTATEGSSSDSGFIRNLLRKTVDLFYLPVMQSPGAKLLLFMRFFMALAYNIFITIWTVSLKSRFSFGPKDHAFFMGWIGLCYAVSQGFLANLLIKYTGEKNGDSTRLLSVCIMGLSLGRVLVMVTSSITVVYGIMAIVIVCLGVMNTAMAAACSRLANSDQIGGLYGVMESVESLAGLFGPTAGGLLFTVHPQLPLASVVLIYMVVLVGVVRYYRSAVVFNETVMTSTKEKAA